MHLQWTTRSNRDLGRLYDFIKTHDPQASKRAIKHLTEAAKQLLPYPHLGIRLEEFNPREVRRLIIGDYEMRYEISGSGISILRLWHCREDR